MASPQADPTSGDFVEIPGEPTFAKTTGIPPIRVPLPLEGKMRSDPLWFLIFTLFGMFGLILLYVAGTMLLAGHTNVFTIIFSPVVGLMAVVIGLNTVAYYVDLLRAPPLLLIDARGFWDRRAANRPLLWTDVARANAIRSKGEYVGVDLRLRRPFAARRTPRSWATLRYLFRRRADELIVSVDFLQNRRAVALAMLELVRRHGGEVRE